MLRKYKYPRQGLKCAQKKKKILDGKKHRTANITSIVGDGDGDGDGGIRWDPTSEDAATAASRQTSRIEQL